MKKRFLISFFLISLLFYYTFSFKIYKNSDIKIYVSTSPQKVMAGEIIRYGILIKNQGSDISSSVILRDTNHFQLEDCMFSIDGENTWFTWNGELQIDPIKPGKIKYVILKCRVNRDMTSSLSNTFTLDVQNDSNPSNNSMTVKNEVIPVADISMEMSFDIKFPEVGDIITLNVIAKNNSNTTSYGVDSHITIPPGVFTLVDYQASQGDYNPLISDWNIGTINGQGKATLKIRLMVNAIGKSGINGFLKSKTADLDFSNNTSVATIYKNFKEDISVSVLPDRSDVST